MDLTRSEFIDGLDTIAKLTYQQFMSSDKLPTIQYKNGDNIIEIVHKLVLAMFIHNTEYNLREDYYRLDYIKTKEVQRIIIFMKNFLSSYPNIKFKE